MWNDVDVVYKSSMFIYDILGLLWRFVTCLLGGRVVSWIGVPKLVKLILFFVKIEKINLIIILNENVLTRQIRKVEGNSSKYFGIIWGLLFSIM